MALSLTDKLVGFIVRPVETFRAVRDEELAAPAIYYLVLLIINAILTAIVAALGFGAARSAQMGLGLGAVSGAMAFIVGLIFAFIAGIILLIIVSIFIHIGAKIMGGRGDFADSLKSSVYALTPYMLLGWLAVIPIIGWLLGLIFFIWSIALLVLGVRELHELDTMKAVIAVVIAVVILFIIAVILGLILGAAFLALFGIASSSGAIPVVTVSP